MVPWVWVVPWVDATRVPGPHVRLPRWVVWIRGARLGAGIMVVGSLRVTRLRLGGSRIMAGPGLHGVLGYLQRTSSGEERLKKMTRLRRMLIKHLRLKAKTYFTLIHFSHSLQDKYRKL